MAKQAMRKDSSEEEVFELDKDERWQARLAEARARRAIALRDKANNEAPPSGRSKPWEEDQDATGADMPLVPYMGSEDSDRLDFSDRVDTLRRTLDKPESTKEKTSRDDDTEASRPEASKPAPASQPSIAGKYVAALPGNFRPEKPHVPATPLTQEQAPLRRQHTVEADQSALAQIYAATMRPDADTSADKVVDEQPLSPRSRRRRGVPALLLAGVCILAILPFSTTVIPRAEGPVDYLNTASPGLGLVPALGITQPNSEFPRVTSSGEWDGQFNAAPRGAAVAPLRYAPLQQRTVGSLPPISTGAAGPGSMGWAQLQSGPMQARPVALAVPQTDGVPALSAAPTSMSAPPLRSDILATDVAPVVETTPAALLAPALPLSESGEVAARGFADPTRTTRSHDLPAPVDLAEPQVATDPAPYSAPVAVATNEVAADRETLPAPVRSLRVTILVPTVGSEAAAQRISDDIVARGHDLAAIKPVNLTISERNLRYYYAEDRAEAARLAEAHGAKLRDFTSFRPQPSEGTVEIWLSGKSEPVVSHAKPARAATPAPVPQPTQRVVVIQRRQSFLGRIFGGLGGGHSDFGDTTTSGGGGFDAFARPATQRRADSPSLGITVDTGGGTATQDTDGSSGAGEDVSTTPDSGSGGTDTAAGGGDSTSGASTSDSGSETSGSESTDSSGGTDSGGSTDGSSSGSDTTSGSTGSDSGSDDSGSSRGGKSDKSGKSKW